MCKLFWGKEKNEKRMLFILFLLAITLVVPISVSTVTAKKSDYNTIQSGLIIDSAGNPLTLGYDEFGYNYQAHIFNGLYDDYDRKHGGNYPGVHLIMKWNDAWLSNKDHDFDGLSDRHYGFDSYIGSGAWLTNHIWGTNPDGTHWDYSVKIVAVPSDAYEVGGIWYEHDGTEIGPAIWGSFAIIQEVINDPSTGEHSVSYLSPAPAGFGYWKP